MLPRSAPRCRPAVGVLTLVAVSAALVTVAAPAATAAPARTHGLGHVKTRAATPAALRVGTTKSGHKATAALTSPAGIASPAGSSLVTGPARSTWNVTYVGFTAQAKAAFQAAVNRWASIVSSSVPITVHADFTAMSPGLLGYASPDTLVSDVSLGDGVSYYPIALADALVGDDIFPGTPDIDASFSSTAPGVYYGTDGNVPVGGIDFETVVMHELGHGLGFGGTADGSAVSGSFDPGGWARYDTFTVDGTGASLLGYASPSASLGSTLRSAVYWNGSLGKAANGGVRPRLYSPNPWEPGSSYSHLDEATYGPGTVNALMTPVLNPMEVLRTPGPLAVAMLRDEGWAAAMPAVPAAATGVSAASLDSAVRVSWAPAVDNGADVDSYTVTASPGGASAVVGGAATTATVSGLTNDTAYTFTVTAHNILGNGPASAAVAGTPALDTLAPTAAFSAAPAALGWTSGKASFGLTATDPGRPGAWFTYTCAIDAGAAAACGPTTTLTLPTGQHTLSVVAYDEALNASAPITRTWNVDATAPATPTVAAPALALGSTVPFSLAGSDSGGSGLSGFSIRWRRAAYNGSWGAMSATTVTTATTYALAAAKGYTYCVYVRSRDKVGNLSAAEVGRCSATPLDDRALVASSGWTRGTGSAYVGGTVTAAKRSGVTLTRAGVQARRLTLVATTCSSCGSLRAYWNGVLIRTVSLVSTTTRTKQALLLKDLGSVHSGTLVLTTTSSKPVYVDALGASRV